MKLPYKLSIGSLAAVSMLGASSVFAQSSASANAPASTRSAPTQACVQAMVAKESAILSNFDAMNAARKAAMQAHKDALAAAALLTDDAARQAAIQKANDDMNTAMKNSMTANAAQEKTLMDAVRSACGNSLGFHGGMKGMEGVGSSMRGGRGHGKRGW